jgi:hypothetical protein
MSEITETKIIEEAIPQHIVNELSDKVQNDIMSKSLTDDEIMDFLNEMDEQEFNTFMAYIDNFFKSIEEENDETNSSDVQEEEYEVKTE